MSTSTQFPFPIQWHEGMLLCPEHFQQTDRRVEKLLSLHLRTFHPFYWGIKKITFDSNALISGILRIQELNAILPDGTHALIQNQDDPALELDLKNLSEYFQNGLITIHLAITNYAPGANNLTGELPRYASFESIPLADENTGEGNKRMPLLRPNLILMPGENISSHYASFPLFKITSTNNNYSISKSFMAPQISVNETDSIGLKILELCTRMREKVAFISNRLTHQRREIMTQEADDAIKALSSSVLPLEALLYSKSCHPFEFYTLLTQIAGNVSSLSISDTLPFFKAYNHHTLQETFKDVLDYIHSVLDQIQEGYYVLPFECKERLFTLAFKPTYINNHMIFGARASKTMTSADIATWIQTAVICSEQFVTSVRDKRILGASRKIVSSDEDLRLLAPRDVVLFSVEYDASFISSDSILCLFNVADSVDKRPEEIAFYLPKQKKDGAY